ncbi:hypothetical protein PMAYCL1PPCAC_25012, partial [Pristionchus mayeri]
TTPVLLKTPNVSASTISPKTQTNSPIFHDKMFILTTATTDNPVMKMNEIKKLIRERGGVVIEDINQVPLDVDAYLIADGHYRTH